MLNILKLQIIIVHAAWTPQDCQIEHMLTVTDTCIDNVCLYSLQLIWHTTSWQRLCDHRVWAPFSDYKDVTAWVLANTGTRTLSQPV